MAYNGNNSGNGNGNGTGSSYTGDSNLEFNFTESPYKFTDPVRYYKSNDPYYWEVDNIPLKQLQENCLWLRDQIQNGTGTGGSSGGTTTNGINRADFNELKPHVIGTDRIVRVKPGNFTARVNDAYGLQNYISTLQAEGPNLQAPEYDPDVPESQDSERLLPTKYLLTLPEETLHKLIGNFTVNAGTPSLAGLGFNGLYDYYRIFNTTLEEGYDLRYQIGQAPNRIPGLKTSVWKYATTSSDTLLSQKLSMEFTKRWKGVARTAVVNVPQELTIDIPAFDSADFMDNSTDASPNYRIDLVFLYTHPVDSKRTRIGHRDGITTITAPKLGLVKGAGLILKKKDSAGVLTDVAPGDIGNEAANDTVEYVLDERNPGSYDVSKSLLSPIVDHWDTELTTIPNGSITFRGSFPSPDDLMNLAPLLADNLVDTDIRLVGQSVLPICYVFSQSGQETQTLSMDHIVDIRPFFRTAELAYNERAGIAAAVPQLSMVNPAVGKRQLQEYARNIEATIVERYDLKISELTALVNAVTNPNKPQFYSKIINSSWPNEDKLSKDGYLILKHTGAGTSMPDANPQRTILYNDNNEIYIADQGMITLKRGIYKIDCFINPIWSREQDSDGNQSSKMMDAKLHLWRNPGGGPLTIDNTSWDRFEGTSDNFGDHADMGAGSWWSPPSEGSLNRIVNYRNDGRTIGGTIIAHVVPPPGEDFIDYQVRLSQEGLVYEDSDGDPSSQTESQDLIVEGSFSITKLADIE